VDVDGMVFALEIYNVLTFNRLVFVKAMMLNQENVFGKTQPVEVNNVMMLLILMILIIHVMAT
jgi:hypothetical protein